MSEMLYRTTKAMSGNWFVQQRQEWISETLRVFGFINREHLKRKFGISAPQASADLKQFDRQFPWRMTYDKSSKRYIARERDSA